MEQPYNIQDPGIPESDFKVYKRRWYILILYSVYSFTQSAVWNTWGPISRPSEEAFNWDDSMIAWMNNWGPISYVLTGLFFPWLLQVKGLRWAVLVSMLCIVAGTFLRVITLDPSTATILIHLGQFLNGVGGPISSGATPAVSATWFSPTERVTATALSTSINVFGTAVGFILGPALVPEVLSNTSTSAVHKSLLFESQHSSPGLYQSNNMTAAHKFQERTDIMRYMYYVCGWSCFIFLVMVCYFPAKPPRPPCMSATIERQHYWKDLSTLATKGHFIIITLVFGVSTGVFGAWMSVLNINLNSVSVTEETAAWMGFYSTVAGCVGAVLVGRFADCFVRHIKSLVLVMYILATAALVVFSLMMVGIITCSVTKLYIATIIVNTVINTAVPLLYEMASELAHPISGGTANGFLTLFSNFCGLIFLAMFSIPHIGSMWMNWAVIGSTAVCIPMLICLKGQFNRLEMDVGIPAENVAVVPEEDEVLEPLLGCQGGYSEVHVRKYMLLPQYYGTHNPIHTDSVMNSDYTRTNSDISDHVDTDSVMSSDYACINSDISDHIHTNSDLNSDYIRTDSDLNSHYIRTNSVISDHVHTDSAMTSHPRL
uniref:Major facilitator superfamily (MFS) profile domain-containing protein n=1 Tax=Arion vulgaris TaxID=1028688 RepID=A0A0B7B0U3_9EUPU